MRGHILIVAQQLIVDGAGRPICTKMWPGNTVDVTRLLPAIDRLRRRFSIARVCVVADGGMISATTIEGLEARKLDYILGARERSDAIVRKIVLENDGPFVPLLIERTAGETQLFVKQVTIGSKRYIVCRNEAEADKDRKDREAIVAALDAQLRKGNKALIGNSAFRRYLRKSAESKNKPAFQIDAGKIAEEARFDGVFVLRTNAKVTPLQAVLRYRDLLQVENLFCPPRRSCARGRFSIPPTPPTGATCFAHSWPLSCKSISTIYSSRRAPRRNGRNCCATLTGCSRCDCSITAPIGECTPTQRR